MKYQKVVPAKDFIQARSAALALHSTVNDKQWHGHERGTVILFGIDAHKIEGSENWVFVYFLEEHALPYAAFWITTADGLAKKAESYPLYAFCDYDLLNLNPSDRVKEEDNKGEQNAEGSTEAQSG